MAGSSSGDGDEAVSLNVTPLIDIIFCLCIFFMCSFHFKQLQGTLDSWLPKNRGNGPAPAAAVPLDEIRVFIRNKGGASELAFGGRTVAGLDELEGLLREEWADSKTRGKADALSVIIDGEPGVPWRDVVGVLDRVRLLQIPRVEFAQPLQAVPTSAR